MMYALGYQIYLILIFIYYIRYSYVDPEDIDNEETVLGLYGRSVYVTSPDDDG